MKINGYFILDGEVKSFHVTDKKRGLDNVLFERARPHGAWIPMITIDDYGEEVLGYKCKNCGWIKPHNKMPFCENCGDDMRKEGEKE